MSILDRIPFVINRQVLLERLHLEPGTDFADEILALADTAEKTGRPKAIYDMAPIDHNPHDGIVVRGVRFTSVAMARTLKEVDVIYPYVCTCGTELDDITLPDDGGFGRFGLDVIKEMALWQASEALNTQLVREFKLGKKASMNPGSGDRKLWPIEEQAPLFRLLGDVKSAIGVTLTDSSLMLPNKSVSGFYFKTDHEYHNCQLCKRESCPNRQAPFDPILWKDSMLDVETCS